MLNDSNKIKNGNKIEKISQKGNKLEEIIAAKIAKQTLIIIINTISEITFFQERLSIVCIYYHEITFFIPLFKRFFLLLVDFS